MIAAAVSGGVQALGAGIESIGEGVTKLGDVTRSLPIVGANIGKLGEAVSRAGESIHALPAVAKTRRGALLVRSVVIGFALIAVWIAAIVALEVHGDGTVDFRSSAERILEQLSRGRRRRSGDGLRARVAAVPGDACARSGSSTT